jgi:hypothetical protein
VPARLVMPLASNDDAHPQRRAAALIVLALAVLFCRVVAADAGINLHLERHGRVAFKITGGDQSCGQADTYRIELTADEGGATVNETGRRCDRFPNDAIDHGAGWVQRGQAGRSVFEPHLGAGDALHIHLAVFRGEKQTQIGRIIVKAYQRTRRVYDYRPGFQNYCIARGLPIHNDEQGDYCVKRLPLSYGARTEITGCDRRTRSTPLAHSAARPCPESPRLLSTALTPGPPR